MNEIKTEQNTTVVLDEAQEQSTSAPQTGNSLVVSNLNQRKKEILQESIDFAIKNNNPYPFIENIKNILSKNEYSGDEILISNLFEIISETSDYEPEYTGILLSKYDLLKNIFTSFGIIKKEKIIIEQKKIERICKTNSFSLEIPDDSVYLQYFIDSVFKYYKQKNPYFKNQDIKYSLLSKRGVLNLCIAAIEEKYRDNNFQNVKSTLLLKQAEYDFTPEEYASLYSISVQENDRKFKETIENILNNFSYYFFEQKIHVIESLISKIESSRQDNLFDDDNSSDKVLDANKAFEDILEVLKNIMPAVKNGRNRIIEKLTSSGEKNTSKILSAIEFMDKSIDEKISTSILDKLPNSKISEELNSDKVFIEKFELFKKELSSNIEHKLQSFFETLNDTIEANTLPDIDAINEKADPEDSLAKEIQAVNENVSSVSEYIELSTETILKKIEPLINSALSSEKTPEREREEGGAEAIDKIEQSLKSILFEIQTATEKRLNKIEEKIDFIFEEAKISADFRENLTK